ncbi:methyltransferase family protein [Opitutus terrae]|uniref:Isoprenylcysteine carboxyl methyltransferase n=1 Tax=Opitutus terrae (strain DSM 11246 / JCM 15787 / PB90-1) TaxID=452637 RepID=B1ZXH1_OPITP|nr:isoprenylcysteine carboxylmethyltransferase family protein [Opitutus terrae]ACB76966.1 Isoprenylcysteine carboxyl methyltransferase [Opitutus terrae PB90-1]
MGREEKRSPGLLGTPPIHPVLFLLAKAAIFGAIVPPLMQLAGFRLRAPVPGGRMVALGLAMAAVMLLILGARALGASLRVGLPKEATELKTGGIYRLSRHPLYVALFLAAAAGCLYCPHPVVLISAALTVLLHHRIALAEERFLEQRFGDAWREHRARVPRYLGWPRTHS